MDYNEIFREVTQRICGTLDIQQAMDQTRQYLKQFIPMDLIMLADGDMEVGHIHCFGISENNSGFLIKEHTYLSPKAHQRFRETGEEYLNGTVWKLDNNLNVMENPLEYEVFVDGVRDAMPAISSVNMSLKIDEVSRGVLVILAKGKNRFKEEHLNLIQFLYHPFAIAMSNYQRYRDVLNMKEVLESENKRLNKELHHIWDGKIIGSSGGLKEVMEMTRQVAKLDSPVLLLGETGVGKEVIANEVHHLSNRKHKPFIKVNCGAIPDNLIDSELFGYEKGAFTGATSQKKGRFERANGGTIFLDEIGELPLQAQVRLLRVIQNQEIERVGGTQTVPIDVRIVSATHRSLEDMVNEGRFREDLWYRINVFPIRIPPLRQRRQDIPELLDFFIKKKSAELKIFPVPPLADGEGEYLIDLPWKGNVRELENMVERALIMVRGQDDNFPLIFSQKEKLLLPESGNEPVTTSDKVDADFPTMDRLQIRHMLEALRRSGGKVQGPGGAAALLGMHPQTLRSRMMKLGIEYRKSRNKF